MKVSELIEKLKTEFPAHLEVYYAADDYGMHVAPIEEVRVEILSTTGEQIVFIE